MDMPLIVGISNWFARNFADAKTRANIIAGDDIWEFWQNPSKETQARMVAAIKAAAAVDFSAEQKTPPAATPSDLPPVESHPASDSMYQHGVK